MNDRNTPADRGRYWLDHAAEVPVSIEDGITHDLISDLTDEAERLRGSLQTIAEWGDMAPEVMDPTAMVRTAQKALGDAD